MHRIKSMIPIPVINKKLWVFIHDNSMITHGWLLILVLLPACVAIIENYETKTSDVVTTLTTFGFLKGGTLDIRINFLPPTTPSVWFVCCTQTESSQVCDMQLEHLFTS